ncbi:MAG: cytochrome P450 [Aliishimia sp.]
MNTAPMTSINLADFAADPYPDLARMRAQSPITFVPQLDAILMTKRDDIHRYEKQIDLFSSDQPGGLMTVLMGQNMMRRDGDDHMRQRKALFPALSPRTVAQHWKPIFERATHHVIQTLRSRGSCDLVTDFAMPISAQALKAITGLTDMTALEMDDVSQAMIDGCANYAGDAHIEARCHTATQLIDAHISQSAHAPAPRSALQVQQSAGLDEADMRANIKLIISGGQNEPRDAIAGTVWALLSHPEQLQLIKAGTASYADAFYEYVRLHSPIGMSPRRVTRDAAISGISIRAESRMFFMFNSAGRDEDYFASPDRFDITRNTSAAIPFGAGPHFCAGAAASRCLITEVALPMLFAALPELELDGEVYMQGWAFRGPLSVPVRWKP